MEAKQDLSILSFEESLGKLEAIVEKMSDQSSDLEQILRLYHEGNDYVKHCRKKLAEAELKLSQITKEIEQEEDASDGS